MQLHAGFTFDHAAALVPYLARLGISHLYCSPILQAAPGSLHGYDVVDPTRLNDDLGGPSAFDRLARELAAHDLSLLVDIVPNHMALAGPANRWWWDLLEDGPASRWARVFDIDWTPAPGATPSVLMPVLGDHLGRVLEAGELRLCRRGGAFSVAYADHELPLSLTSLAPMLEAVGRATGADDLVRVAEGIAALPSSPDLDARHHAREAWRAELRGLTAARPPLAAALDAALGEIEGDPDALERLLAAQSYRLAHWRTASEELDYRRFFDVTDLVGVRVEDPEVFDATHERIRELVADGHVAALRIDHVDGLRDPAGYLDRLHEAMGGAPLLVEKILAPAEALPPAWPVAGTTGYDQLNRVGDLFVDPVGLAVLEADHAAHVDPAPADEIAHDARWRVSSVELAAEGERLVDLLEQACRRRRRHGDHTRRDLRRALHAVLTGFTVYRTYAAPGEPTAFTDRARVGEALATARARHPDVDGELLGLIGAILLLDEPGAVETELALRFQQLSGPVMAKGVEDTTFYRYVPLLARNEVGAEPGALRDALAAFHEHHRRVARSHPGTMGALSTHDTKRSADVRARLLALSEVAQPWVEQVDRWRRANERHWPGGPPDRLAELVLYQTMVGAWPVGADRLLATMLKAAREAKLRTSWRDPDEAYEAALERFVAAVATDPAFVASLEAFLAEHEIVLRGRRTSLAQVALQMTSPGFPDVYQGDEVWNLSLVDPDNRRPVDHERNAALLEAVVAARPTVALADDDAGAWKLWLVHRLLQHRRSGDEPPAGAYEPLWADGPARAQVVAFAWNGVVTVVPRLRGVGDAGWGATALALPPGTWRSVLADHDHGTCGPVHLDDLLGADPVAVLARDGR